MARTETVEFTNMCMICITFQLRRSGLVGRYCQSTKSQVVFGYARYATGFQRRKSERVLLLSRKQCMEVCLEIAKR